MPTQVEYPFLGLASGSADGAVAHNSVWLGTLRAAVEARDMVESRRVLHNVDDGAQGTFDDMEKWKSFVWHGARWCIDRDWFDGVKLFLEESEHPRFVPLDPHKVLQLLLDASLDIPSEDILRHVMSYMDGEDVDIDQPRTADGATLLHLAARAGRQGGEVGNGSSSSDGFPSKFENSRRKRPAQCPVHGRVSRTLNCHGLPD